MRPDHSDSAIASWLNKRTERWRRLRELGENQRDAQDERVEEVRELAEGFRSLARDISLARGVLPQSRVTRQLETLFQTIHDAIYRPPANLKYEIQRLFGKEVPRVVKRLRGTITAVFALFVCSGWIGWSLVTEYPELAALFASEPMINMVQRGELWTEGLLNVFPSSLLSVAIFTNNIVVALFAFCFGALYGLGTLYLIGMNGLMLGGIFAFTAQHQLDGKLFNFVVAHGIVELSIICLAGAAGVHLGEALAYPGDRSRSEAFRDAVREAATLLPVFLLFLIGAGIIEGYISPDPTYSLASRVWIGLAYGGLLVLALSGRLWPGARRSAEEQLQRILKKTATPS